MIVVSWNCRGLTRATTVNHLRAMINNVKPNIFFLAKTMVADNSRTLRQDGFDNFFLSSS